MPLAAPSKTVPFIDFHEQHRSTRRSVLKAVCRVIDSHQYILKDEVPALETIFAKKIGARHAIGVASGSDALYLSLWAAGIGKGDEVITTPFTFFATAGAISRTGAKPVFVDIDADTFNINPKKIEAVITSHTKALIPVHLFGLMADMEAILKIAKKRSLFVVEDVAQAYGARLHGKPAGSFGNAACFSFFPTKNLGGGGDGGMVVTSSDALTDKIRVLRVHGSKKRYHHELIGINSRLDEIQAAIVSTKLGYVEGWNQARRKIAERYKEGLAGLPVKTPSEPGGFRHVYHLYSILSEKRDALAAFLSKKGIGTGIYYPVPLHLQPCYRFLKHREGDFPESEKVSRSILALPMFPELSLSSQKKVILAVKEFHGQFS